MSIGMSFRIAVKALGRNKLRTALTMLGMIIGVAAVMTMVALGNGAQASVANEVQNTGTTMIHVTAGNYTRGGEDVNIPAGRGAATTLVREDIDAIVDQVDGVKEISAMVVDRAQVTTPADKRHFGKIVGTDVQFPSMYTWSFSAGQYFTPGDVTSRRNVAVLGSAVATRLFGTESPLNQEIRVWNQRFDVIGVTSAATEDHADSVFVPYTTAQDMLGIKHLHSVSLTADSAGITSRVSDDIRKLLRQRHGMDAEEAALRAQMNQPQQSVAAADAAGIDLSAASGDEGIIIAGPQGPKVPDDFTIRTQAQAALTKGLYTQAAVFVLANLPQLDDITLDELSNTLDQANTTMTALLASIAAVSLIVGGIGIMNIMLVSVTERTREIGIRMAVGARGRDVLLQFLVEALTISLIGGVIGIILGFAASDGVSRALAWPADIAPSTVALAFGIAALIGIFFGFYPARKASRLDPIDALRYE